MSFHRWLQALLVLPAALQDPGRLDLTSRWRLHYLAVERELRAEAPQGRSPAEWAARCRALDALAAYRERGEFTRQAEPDLGLVPQFVDREGRRCAVAELLHASGRADMVERVRGRDNQAWVVELAGDPELRTWLAQNGLTLAEAVRIQTPAFSGPGDYVAPGGRMGEIDGGTAKGTGPAGRPAGAARAPDLSPGATPGEALAGNRRSPAATEPTLDGWWAWWEFNKLAYLPLLGMEERLRAEPSRTESETRAMTEPLRMARIPMLLAALRDPEAQVRAAAAVALGRTGREAAVAPLVALLGDPSLLVRERALLALGSTGTSAGARTLLALLESGGRLEGRELGLLHAMPLAILALAIGQQEGMDPALAGAVALIAPRVEEGQRDQALWAACLFQRLAPDPALEDLALRLWADRELPTFVRAAALEALGGSSDPRVLPRLQGALFGRELELRRSAALALGRSPQVLASAILMSAYELESEPLARGFALLALGQRGGAAAQSFLLRALQRGPSSVEPWAALALGLLARSTPDRGVTSALLESAVQARNQESRSAALLALGLAREPGASALARTALESSDSPRERGYAATTLALLGGLEHGNILRARLALERSGFVRATIAQGLAALGQESDAASLFTALRGLADPGLRAVTAASLGQLGSASALLGLEELAGNASGSALVRATALEGLGVLLERGRPLVLPDATQGANYMLYEDWAFELFLVPL